MAGFILSVLTLPFPYSWVECLKGRVVIDDGTGQEEPHKEEKEEEEEDEYEQEEGSENEKPNQKKKPKSK